MSLEGDALPAQKASSPVAIALGWLGRSRAFGRYVFAGFIAVHFAFQAFRARTSGTLAEPGLEAEPWFVAALLLLVGVPFLLFATHELRRALPIAAPEARSARALAVAERLALVVVLLFCMLHCAQIAWPLFDGSALAADVRPSLVQRLSSTSHGVPVQAALYICGVAAAAFYATRQLLAALAARGAPSRAAARVVVSLGVLGYVLGSYAVIRCAGGALWP